MTARAHRSLPLRLRLAFLAALGCTACAEQDFDDGWAGEPWRGDGAWSYPLPYRGHHAHRPPPPRDPCRAHGSGRNGGCGDARSHQRRPDGHRHDASDRSSEHPRGGERDGRPRSVSPGPVKAPAASPPRVHAPASAAPRPASPGRPANPPPRSDRRPERKS